MSEHNRKTFMYSCMIAAEVGASAYLMWRMIPQATRQRAFMRVAKTAESRCMRNAQTWANLADKASHAYEANRNVAV